MIQEKKNQRAMSITFYFLRGLKKVLLHTYVVAGRRLLKNTVIHCFSSIRKNKDQPVSPLTSMKSKEYDFFSQNNIT